MADFESGLAGSSSRTTAMSQEAAGSATSGQSPSSEWLRSIDSVYSLFENPQVSQRYPQLAKQVKNAVQLCEEVIRDVGQQHCALSFNGGKDCTVLVHILAAVLRRIASAAASATSSSQPTPLPPIPSLYITCPSPFPTVEKFVRYCVSPIHGYNLDLVSVSGGMKAGIQAYLDGAGTTRVGIPEQENQHDTPTTGPKRDIRAMFVGTRRDDPHGPSLSPRSWTDKDWPRVERIHPILEWTYKDVWDFLRCPHLASSEGSLGMSRQELAEEHGVAGGGEQGVPYCLLYDQGYTSLGSTFNTQPNPELRITSDQESDNGSTSMEPKVVGDGTAKGLWKPAYMLQDGSLERAGRIEQPKKQPPHASTTLNPEDKTC